MPNQFSTQEQFSQNGYSPDRKLSLNSFKQISSLRESKSSAPLNEDWSSLTKELIDTLPRVWTRGLLYWLIVFAAIVLPWAMLSKVDETGSARGRLEPQGKTLRLDAPVAGKVALIKVKEGQSVRSGQTLLQLESELSRTDLQQAQAKLEGQQNRVNQLQLLKNQLQMSLSTQQLQNQAQESEQLAQLDQIQQRLNSGKQVYALEKGRLKLAKNEVQRYRYLWQNGAISKSKLEEIEGAMFDRQRLLEQAQSDIQQADTEIAKQQSANQRIKRTGELAVLDNQKQLREFQAQIIDVQSEIAQTKKQIHSLQFQLQQQTLQTPIDGTIFQLSVNNAGSVVQPGQMITQIAPQGVPLIFRAQMPSQESGFLRVGMPVKLKFDAYPFQDYGVVEGQLRWVSPETKVVETPQGKLENFELEIAVSQTYIQGENKRIALTPGQTATAEIIVRQRRIIDFVLDPFKKLQKDGLKL
ncbi:HlyD family efflux transporter periplasmic adaptor subunit [Nostoc sp. FACHB-152]|uniref:HlyD family efflux transporter periplasmic adaptor subunit n=1 Tax=unclassified Nostoc TaxID=2593658 RepID=UPI001689318F|nr:MULTISPECIES: HlyD family efflux transporter periplasmic adaptor subunit [unclassified Nostoc]MBD2451461.1 HlyD family efflux transporter periplasmic adaptor subunit [Nostoc sp. FACHB-152]MBD2472502.1 HlyD family efflux transporter periplasmic adaptor subunit [Nostoc sp. FACHB-145]